MMDRRAFVLTFGATVAVPAMARANTGILTPQEAHDAMTAGRLLLVDIRTPDEWKQTGVAEGAWPLDMRDRKFGPSLMAMIDRNPDHKISVICRTGSRSGYLVDVLKQNGIHGVLDVSEGMVGGRYGPGWIKTGLPIVKSYEALSAMPKDLRAS